MAPRPLSRPDLNLLAVLEAVVAEGSLTRGGARFGMSQSSTSHALERLRRLVDDQLFVRRGRALVPTPRAVAIASQARRALDLLDGSLTRAVAFDPSRDSRRFLLELPGGLDAVLAPLLAGRLPTGAAANFRLAAGRRVDLRSEIERHELWFALGYDADVPEGFIVDRIADWQPVVVARKGLPALRRGLTRKAYVAAEHVVLDTYRGTRDMPIMSRIKAAGIDRRVRFTVESLQAAAALVVEAGMLSTMMPPVADFCARHYSIDVHALPFDVPPMSIYSVWHERMQTDESHRWLRQTLIELIHGL